jgi:leucyl-tRNA synthetase
VYRLVDKHAGTARDAKGWDFNPKGMSDKERELVRITYQTMQRVTQDFERRWHFNSAIAQIMELTNEVYSAEPLEDGVRPEIRKEILEILILLLAPMTPHIAEELWEMLGHSDGLWNAEWPYLGVEQEELARDEQVEVVVQVNGKVRGRMPVPVGLPDAKLIELAQEVVRPYMESIQGALATHRPPIVVRDKLVNLIVVVGKVRPMMGTQQEK